jgi:hypothetical protein
MGKGENGGNHDFVILVYNTISFFSLLMVMNGGSGDVWSSLMTTERVKRKLSVLLSADVEGYGIPLSIFANTCTSAPITAIPMTMTTGASGSHDHEHPAHEAELHDHAH